MSITSNVPAGFQTMRFEGICDQYSYTLEQEPWYLLCMDPESGEWELQIRYQDAEASTGESDRFEVATLAYNHIREQVAKGVWCAAELAKAFEVAVVVPEHVAKLML